MLSDQVCVEVRNLSKIYEIYTRPVHRLMQTLFCGTRHFYREFRALDNVSFRVKTGQCFGIIGMNGAGKSTLLQIFADTLEPTSGEVAVHGRIAALLELGSGFSPEFTGKENVYMNASLLGLTKSQIDARYEQITAFADIGEAIDQPVKTYSSGMMMRLAFAVIAHIDADILIIDEALSVGDVVFTQKCMKFMRSFMQEHTVILVTHDTGAVLNMCDEVLWLDHGKVMEIGQPKTVVEHYLAFCYKKQQGEFRSAGQISGRSPEKRKVRDVRQERFNSSNLVHEYEFFEFNENAPSFGAGGAVIESIQFYDENGGMLVSTLGGEDVRLEIRCRARQDIFSPIVGFAIRNYLGENLFGDNTYVQYRSEPRFAPAGSVIKAVFSFQMPRLKSGEYTLHAAIAEGTQTEHIQHQWFHDALRIKSHYMGEQGVLVGIPMERITLDIER